MPENRTQPTAVQRVVGVLIALITSPALSGWTLTFSYAWGGMVPLLVGVVARLLVYDMVGGLPLAVLAFLMSIVPAAFAVRGLRWQRPFAQKIRTTLIAEVVSVAITVVCARIYLGGGLEKLSEMAVNVIETYVSQGQSFLSSAELDLIAQVESQLPVTLPLLVMALIITSAAMDGLMMVVPASWLMHRRHQGGAEGYAPMITWRLPRGSIIGLFGMLAVSYLMYVFGISGGDAVFLCVEGLVNVFFMAQACGAFARFAARTNMPRYVRNIFLVFLLTLFQRIFAFVGCFSALFGSAGVISTFFRNRRQGHDT